MDAIKGLPYDPRMNIQFLISGVLLVSYTIRQKYLKKIWKKMDGYFLRSEDIYLYDSERDSFMMALKALGIQ